MQGRQRELVGVALGALSIVGVIAAGIALVIAGLGLVVLFGVGLIGLGTAYALTTYEPGEPPPPS